jgi:beta-mannosidase
MTQWRAPVSACQGSLAVALSDLRAGAGWGLIDVLGRPKSPWYVLKRIWQPLAVLVTDEGNNGLKAHLMNDMAEPFTGSIRVQLFTPSGKLSEVEERYLTVPGRTSHQVQLAGLFDGFRDISYAYMFGPPGIDAVLVEWLDREGVRVSEQVFLPAGQGRPLEQDVGLVASASRAGSGAEGEWILTVSTERLAQWVAIDVPGYRASDSWFHLAPGVTREIGLVPVERIPVTNELRDASAPIEKGGFPLPSGQVRALNSVSVARIAVSGD